MSPQTATPTPHEAVDANLLGAIREHQHALVDLAKKWVDDVGGIAPELWEAPIVAGGPAPRDVTDAAFQLTRKLLDAQLAFTRRIIDSVVEEVKGIG